MYDYSVPSDDVVVKASEHFGDALRVITRPPCEIAGVMVDRLARTGTTIPDSSARLPSPLDVRIPVVLDGREWLLHYAGQSLVDIRHQLDSRPRYTAGGPEWLPVVWPQPQYSHCYLIGMAVLTPLSESAVVMRVHMDDMTGNVTRVEQHNYDPSDMVALRWIDDTRLGSMPMIDQTTNALAFRSDWEFVQRARENDSAGA